MEPQNQPSNGYVHDVSELRRKRRFKLVIDIQIHSESCGSLKGRTVDISEIGIAAVLGDDVPLGEMVKLHFTLPSGPVTIDAAVRQSGSFFRYGFEFTESNSVRDVINAACRELAIQQPASSKH